MLPPVMKLFGKSVPLYRAYEIFTTFLTTALEDVDEPAPAQLVAEIGGSSLAAPSAATLKRFELAEAARTKR